MKDECGVAGVFGTRDASKLVYLSLLALQHRGQEGCGIVSIDRADGWRVNERRRFGLVADQFSQSGLEKLVGDISIGHVRYSTKGGRLINNIQPFILNNSRSGPFAIAQNGNITNAELLRKSLEESGSVFSSTTDSEVILHLIARHIGYPDIELLKRACADMSGAFSMVVLTPRGMMGVRDPFGFRPLVLGKGDGFWILASESCAFDLVGAKYIREIEPGEIVSITQEGIMSDSLIQKVSPKFCSFESIYFSRVDSRVGDSTVYTVRKKLGEELAREQPADADLVIAVPDSSVPMALGFSQQSKIPLELGLARNHYVGRTFIEPDQEIRDFGVRIKLNPVFGLLQDKRVAVVDDSLVRGTTSRKIVKLLRDSGACEVHMRIASPPVRHSCFYGISTPHRSQLIAAIESVENISDIIGVDTLGYLSMDGLMRVLDDLGSVKHCYACFTGDYPEVVPENTRSVQVRS